MVDTLDNVNYLQRPIVYRDVTDPRELDLNTLYACLSGTTKHIGTSFTEGPFVSDLRTGAMSGGSGEQAILSSACVQMGQCYDLPVGVPAGMTDSKEPDAQSCYEKRYTEVLLAQAGCNMIYECAGIHASLLGFFFEGAILDNDMIGSVLRTVRGIEVDEDVLSVENIRQVCTEGPVHFLGHTQTMDRMEID